MSTGITDELVNMQTWTAIQQQASQQLNGTSNEMNQDMFLKLMLEQLKYQDPLNPMDNQEFLAQQAQFTQLSELQELNESITSNNTVQQCISLIGKEVTVIDPDNTSQTLTGVVEEAVFDTNGSSVKINGKTYPLGLVTSIKDSSNLTANTNTQPSESQTEESGSILNSVAGIADTLNTIAAKLTNYL